MIKNNPVDLATRLLRFEKRAKAIRLLNSTRRVSSVPLMVVILLMFGLAYLQIWMFRDRLPAGMLSIATGLIAPIGILIGQFFVTHRRVQALVDLVLLDIDEAAEAEHEAQLQKSAKRERLTEAAS